MLPYQHNPSEPLAIGALCTVRRLDDQDELLMIDFDYLPFDRADLREKQRELLLPPDWEKTKTHLYRLSDDAAFWHGAAFVAVIENLDVRKVPIDATFVFGKARIHGDFVVCLQDLAGEFLGFRNFNSCKGILEWIGSTQRTWKDYYHDKPGLIVRKGAEVPEAAPKGTRLN